MEVEGTVVLEELRDSEVLFAGGSAVGVGEAELVIFSRELPDPMAEVAAQVGSGFPCPG